MPKFFSLGFIIGVIGVAYVANAVWTFYNIYFPAWCNPTNPNGGLSCVHPKYLCDTTDLVFQGWISRLSSLPDKRPNHVAIKIFDRAMPCNKMWEETVSVDLDPIYKSNATYYIHILVLPRTKQQEVVLSNLSSSHADVLYQKVIMTKQLVEERTAMNLIASGELDSFGNSSSRSRERILHWHTKLRLHVMDTPITFDRMSIPHELHSYLKFRSEKNGELSYWPLLFIDTLSGKRDEFVSLRSRKVNLTLEYSPLSAGKIRLISMIGASLDQLRGFGLQDSDLEDVVAIFTETNFYILILTIMVTVLHLIFDFLAFKNDIIFWRKQKTVAGLSGRTILWRAFSQVVVFLYLLEEKSSLLISIPAGIGCFIEMWKVLKLWKFAGFERNGWRVRMKFNTISAAERSSDDIDAGFVRKLSYLLMPLCIAGAVYSLFYVPHKSWYSWTVQSAVNGVYAFGFLFMVPQLYLNYKLKSVAHLPWKVFSYKALNTFIDDLFAFIVKMPLAHRLACFRDDIIFVFYLIQWYIYPVDKSRANEFGQSFDDAANSEKGAVKDISGAKQKESKKTR